MDAASAATGGTSSPPRSDSTRTIGTGPEFDARISTLIDAPVDPDAPSLLDLLGDENSVGARAFTNPGLAAPDGSNITGMRAWRAAEIPAANGHCTARSLARIYGGAVDGGEIDGVHIIDPDTLETAIIEQSNGPDTCLMIPTRFGLGFMLTGEFLPLGPNPRSFGHPGAGGSLGYGDLDANIGFGYTMNQMQNNLSGRPPRPGPAQRRLRLAVGHDHDRANPRLARAKIRRRPPRRPPRLNLTCFHPRPNTDHMCYHRLRRHRSACPIVVASLRFARVGQPTSGNWRSRSGLLPCRTVSSPCCGGHCRPRSTFTAGTQPQTVLLTSSRAEHVESIRAFLELLRDSVTIDDDAVMSHALGLHWFADIKERSQLGDLVEQAKDYGPRQSFQSRGS